MTSKALNQSISIVVQGDPKCGKSTLGVTTPTPRLLIDIEGGTRFLNIKPVKWDPVREEPPEDDGSWDTAVVRVNNYDDIVKAYQWLASGKHPFKSVTIDSVSEAQQSLIESLVGRNAVQTQQWGEILRNFTGLMRDFRDLTDHPTVPLTAVVLVAMTKRDDQGRGRPWLQGQSAVVLPYLFDMSIAMIKQGYTDDQGQRQVVFRALVGENPFYDTGERVNWSGGQFIDNPTVTGIIETVYGRR